MYVRTDLALEEKELWQQSADEQTELSGVRAREYRFAGDRGEIRRQAVAAALALLAENI